MNGDAIVERAAARLEERARKLARRNGVRAKLAAELDADADFLRRMKPSLVRARLRESPPSAADGHAGGRLRERLEAERAEARELLGRMKPREWHRASAARRSRSRRAGAEAAAQSKRCSSSAPPWQPESCSPGCSTGAATRTRRTSRRAPSA